MKKDCNSSSEGISSSIHWLSFVWVIAEEVLNGKIIECKRFSMIEERTKESDKFAAFDMDMIECECGDYNGFQVLYL